MSQVKWVDASSLKDNAGKCDCDVGSIGPVPVVPLSALRVELQEIMPFCTKGQGNAYLSIAEIRERLERLLASLGEVGNG